MNKLSQNHFKDALGGGVSLKKIFVSVVGLIVLSVVTLLFFLVLPWSLLFVGINSLPNPPQPAIKYGEFPFRLEYEINGQRKVIQDTLICEYDGVGSDEGRGKFRKWKEKLASGKEEITLIQPSDSTEIFFFPGSAEYYMGDSHPSNSDSSHGRNDSSFPDALYKTIEGKITTSGLVTERQLLEEYSIKLIKWDASPPIKNNFVP
ncbi:hypothetical protein [Paenibacillus tuaregi]|uniref:hypothetical protein n=1 Tax=Paenibacillus tuaregi TaxID=1816681 RepID=UPI000AF06990|nr:hypothetical protein [Paenibacillus tuaregi]